MRTFPRIVRPPAQQDDSRKRLYFIDSVRCFAFILLIGFHAGFLFTPRGWHLHAPHGIPGLADALHFLAQWRMPLIFLVSGCALSFSFDRYPGIRFPLRCAKRLLPPLIFGVCLLIPPVAYLEKLQSTEPERLWASYANHFANLFQGNLRWLHLWYLGYLSAFCIGIWILASCIRHWILRIRNWQMGDRWIHLVWAIGLCLPLILCEIFLRPHFPAKRNFISDWASVFEFAAIFTYGFILFRNGHFCRLLAKHRCFILLAGICSYATIQLLGFEPNAARPILTGINSWLWIMAIMGFSYRHLNRRIAFVHRFNRIIFPFYLIHQVVLLGLASLFFGALPWMNSWVSYLSITLLTTIASCLLISKVIVPIAPLGFLFGIEPRQRPKKPSPETSPPAILETRGLSHEHSYDQPLPALEQVGM